jgi:phospholipase A1
VAKVDRDVEASLDLSPEKTRGFSLADHWELDQEHRRGIFNFRPHNVNYLMVTRTAHPNNEPYRPFRDLGDLTSDLSRAELVFQLGFKTKLVETAFDKPVDVWFGYTQNSFWQAGNRQASSPFRETNYQPELMVVTPLNLDLLGMHASFLNLGVVHQSNGQAGRCRAAGTGSMPRSASSAPASRCWGGSGSASTKRPATTTIRTSSTTWAAAT